MGNLVKRLLRCIDHSIGACLFAALLVLAGCATVPITGRSQVNLFSEEEMVAIADDQFSRFMGFVTQEGAVLSETDSPEAAAVLQSVDRISEGIIEAAGLRDRYNWQIVVVSADQYYGYATGIVGLRLFPNPNFDEQAEQRWDPERFFTDPSYYNDKKLVRPYRVGMSCGFCHVGPNPSKPPQDPEHPKWENLN